LTWLQPAAPEEADRRDKTARGPHFLNAAHDRLPWYPRGGLSTRTTRSWGPYAPRQPAVGRNHRCGPPVVLSGAAPPPDAVQAPAARPVFDFDAVWDLGIVKIVELA
jgi:hypothetical protein